MEGRGHQPSTFSGRQVPLEMGKLRVGGSGRPVPAVFPTASSKRARTGPPQAAVAPQPEVQRPFLPKTVVQRPGHLSTSHVPHASTINKVATQCKAAHANPSRTNEKAFNTTQKQGQETLQSNAKDTHGTTLNRQPAKRSSVDENGVAKRAKVHARPIASTLRSEPSVPNVYTARELALFTHRFEPRHATSTDTTRYHQASHSHSRPVTLSSLPTSKQASRSWQSVHASLDHLYETDETIGLMQLRQLHPSTRCTARKNQRQVEHARTRTATSVLRKEQSKEQQRWTEKQQRKARVAHLSIAIRRQNQTRIRQVSSDRNEQRGTGVPQTEIGGSGGTRKPPVPRLSRFLASRPGQEAKLNSTTGTGGIKEDRTLIDTTSEAKELGTDIGKDVQLKEKAAMDNGKTMPWKRPRVVRLKQERGMADERVQAAKRARETRRALARDYMQSQQQSRRMQAAKMREQAHCERRKRQWQLERLEATRLKKLRSARRKVRAEVRVEDGTMETRRGIGEVREGLEGDVGEAGAMERGVKEGEEVDGGRNEELKTAEETRGTAVDDVVDARVQKLLELQAKTTALSARLSGLRHQRDQMETVDDGSKVSFEMKKREEGVDEKRASLVECHVLEETPVSKPEQEQERERDGEEEEGRGGEGASVSPCHSIPSTGLNLKGWDSIETKGNGGVEFQDDTQSVVSVDWKAWNEIDKRTDEQEEVAIRSIGVHSIQVVWPLEHHEEASQRQSFEDLSSSSSSSCTSSRPASPVASQWLTFPSTCREEAKEEMSSQEVTNGLTPCLLRERASESDSDGFATPRLIRLIRETDDSLSVIDRGAHTLYEAQQSEVEDERERELQARMQAEKRALVEQDEKVAAVMASFIDVEGTEEEDEDVEGSDEEKDGRYKRLEEIMAEVEQERDQEERSSSACDGSPSSPDALDDIEEASLLPSGQDSSNALASSVYWDHVVATSRLESTPPRKALNDASGVACNLIRPPSGDTQRVAALEETERKDSPRTLATKLLAAVDYQEAMVAAQQQLATMADAFQREQDVKRAQLRECSVQTEALRQVDAATCATLCVETSTSPIRGGVDAAVQVEARTGVDQEAVEEEQEESWEHADDAYEETFEAPSQDDEGEMDGSGVDRSVVLSRDFEEEEEALDGLADADASGVDSVIEEDVARDDVSGEASMEVRDEFESEEQDEVDERRRSRDEMDERVDEDERSDAMAEEIDEERGRVEAVSGDASREDCDSNESVRSRTNEAMRDVEEERVDRSSARAQEDGRFSIGSRATMEAQSAAYRVDLERRQQAEVSLLQLRLATLEQQYRGKVEQLKRRDDRGGALQRQKETLTMAFMAEKAHVESFLAASKARYYHDLHAFQSLLMEWPRAVDLGEPSPRPVSLYERGVEQGFVAVEASLDREHATVSDEEYADEFVSDSGGSHDAMKEERDKEVGAIALGLSVEEIGDSGQDHVEDVDTIERKEREFEVTREVDEVVEEVEDEHEVSVEEEEDGQETLVEEEEDGQETLVEEEEDGQETSVEEENEQKTSVEEEEDGQETSVEEAEDGQETSVEGTGYNQETSVEEEEDGQETSVEEEEDGQETSVEEAEDGPETSVEEEDGQEPSVEVEEDEHETSVEVAEDDQETLVEGTGYNQETSVEEARDGQETSVEEEEDGQETSVEENEDEQEPSVDEEEDEQETSVAEVEDGQKTVLEEVEDGQETSVEEEEDGQETSVEEVGYDQETFMSMSEASTSHRDEILEGKSVEVPVVDQTSEPSDQDYGDDFVSIDDSFEKGVDSPEDALKAIESVEHEAATSSLGASSGPVATQASASEESSLTTRLVTEVTSLQQERTTVPWSDAEARRFARKRIQICDLLHAKARLVHHETNVFRRDEAKRQLDHVARLALDVNVAQHVARAKAAIVEEVAREVATVYETYAMFQVQADVHVPTREEGKVSVLQKLFDPSKGSGLYRVDEAKERRVNEKETAVEGARGYKDVESEDEEERMDGVDGEGKEERPGDGDGLDQVESLVDEVARSAGGMGDEGRTVAASSMDDEDAYERDSFDDVKSLVESEDDEDDAGYSKEEFDTGSDSCASAMHETESKRGEAGAQQGLDASELLAAREKVGMELEAVASSDDEDAWLTASVEARVARVAALQQAIVARKQEVHKVHQQLRVEKKRALLVAREKELWDELDTIEKLLGKEEAAVVACGQRTRVAALALEWKHYPVVRERRDGVEPVVEVGREGLNGYTYIEAAEAGTLADRADGRERASGKGLESREDGTEVLGDYDYVEAVAVRAVDRLAAYDYVERVDGKAFKSTDEDDETQATRWKEGALTLGVAKEVAFLRDERDACDASSLTKKLDRVTELVYADVMDGLEHEMMLGGRALAEPSHATHSEAELQDQDDEVIGDQGTEKPSVIVASEHSMARDCSWIRQIMRQVQVNQHELCFPPFHPVSGPIGLSAALYDTMQDLALKWFHNYQHLIQHEVLVDEDLILPQLEHFVMSEIDQLLDIRAQTEREMAHQVHVMSMDDEGTRRLSRDVLVSHNCLDVNVQRLVSKFQSDFSQASDEPDAVTRSVQRVEKSSILSCLYTQQDQDLQQRIVEMLLADLLGDCVDFL